MTARFVNIPADAIRSRLSAAGFARNVQVRGKEEVYERKHEKDSRYIVRVYSSITAGDDEARGSGTDAIRVIAILVDSRFHYPPKGFTIFKGIRVHRAGTIEKVLDRMIERAREAYKACSAHRAESGGLPANDTKNDRAKARIEELGEWRRRASEHLKKMLNLHDLLEEDDPYDVREMMIVSYRTGKSPESFIENHFAEDLARRAREEVQ